MGFSQGAASPCCFRHARRDTKRVVHGDDFTVLGPESDLKWFAREFAKHFEIKIRGILGPNAGDTHEIRILNRIVRWTAEGLEYEVDQRHAAIILK